MGGLEFIGSEDLQDYVIKLIQNGLFFETDTVNAQVKYN